MSGHIQTGDRLPAVRLAELDRDEIRARPAQDIFGGKRAVIVGVPGAFTPVCSRLHLPRFIELAPSMLASGFDMIACVAPNDPWTLAVWSRELDPEDRIRFLSDGNREFGRACGLSSTYKEHFLGESFLRFSMIVANCVVERLNVERSPLEVTCSSADACMLAPRAA
jgi:2-Cys peroxiredoxin 5